MLKYSFIYIDQYLHGSVVQSVASPTADPGVTSLIPARSNTVVKIDLEIICSTVILLPSSDSRMVVVSYKGKYVHEVLVKFT